MTIFETPLVTPLLRGLFRLALRLSGWQIVGQLPDLPKYIVVDAPHTSNWDFVMFLALAFVLKGNMRYMGKAELFRSPLGGFFRWCGGVPVDRSKPQGLVEQMVQAIREIGPIFTLTDDIEADLATIQAFFKDKVGINPRLTSAL